MTLLKWTSSSSAVDFMLREKHKAPRFIFIFWWSRWKLSRSVNSCRQPLPFARSSPCTTLSSYGACTSSLSHVTASNQFSHVTASIKIQSCDWLKGHLCHKYYHEQCLHCHRMPSFSLFLCAGFTFQRFKVATAAAVAAVLSIILLLHTNTRPTKAILYIYNDPCSDQWQLHQIWILWLIDGIFSYQARTMSLE